MKQEIQNKIKELKSIVPPENLYDDDTDTCSLIAQFCEFFKVDYCRLWAKLPHEAYLMINFLDILNTYGEEYAYINLIEAMYEDEEKLGKV